CQQCSFLQVSKALLGCARTSDWSSLAAGLRSHWEGMNSPEDNHLGKNSKGKEHMKDCKRSSHGGIPIPNSNTAIQSQARSVDNPNILHAIHSGHHAIRSRHGSRSIR